MQQRHTYAELRGTELRGPIEFVGKVPRTGTPDPKLAEPERLCARKYNGTDVMDHTSHHAWLRLAPNKVTSWDLRKKAASAMDALDFG